MKSARLAVAISLAFVLTLLVVSLVTAAPGEARPAVQAQTSNMLYDPITPTVTPAPTVTTRITHPVGLAIALHFHIPYTEVMALHDSGIGFGVIARSLLTARALSGTLSFTQVLALHQSGVGWGQIFKQYGVHPGGQGLGSIMRDHPNKDGLLPNKPGPKSGANTGDQTNCPGNSCNSPGKHKQTKGPKK
jgi:hypothetical protein